jgi:hypothetical protein
VSETN